MESKLGKVGVIGRFKPLHNGGAILLETLCEKSDRLIIGIGSSNKYNARNPFSAKETEKMINLLLSPKYSNYSIIKVPDFAHNPGCENGHAWKEFVIEKFGKLDYFVSGNDFVRDLLKESYNLIYPTDLIPKEKHVRLRATKVRYQMATFQDWESLVPKTIAEYLIANKLVDRFRDEFGLETLSSVTEGEYDNKENATQEMLHAREK